jgi:hypothetical protein
MLALRRLVSVVVGCLVLVQAGCTKIKVKDELEFDLGGQDKQKIFDVPAQKSEMILSVEVKSTDAPVYGKIIDDDQTAKEPLDKKDAKEFTLSATIPANTPCQVVIVGFKPTKVTVKITGKEP